MNTIKSLGIIHCNGPIKVSRAGAFIFDESAVVYGSSNFHYSKELTFDKTIMFSLARMKCRRNEISFLFFLTGNYARVFAWATLINSSVVFNGLSLRDAVILTLYSAFVRRSYSPRGSIN